MPRAEAAAGGAQDVHQHAREEGGREGRGENTDHDDDERKELGVKV